MASYHNGCGGNYYGNRCGRCGYSITPRRGSWDYPKKKRPKPSERDEQIATLIMIGVVVLFLFYWITNLPT